MFLNHHIAHVVLAMPAPEHVMPLLRLSLVNSKIVLVTNPASDLVRVHNAARAYIAAMGFSHGQRVSNVVRIRPRDYPDGVLAMASTCASGTLVIGVSKRLNARERRAAVRAALRGARALPVEDQAESA